MEETRFRIVFEKLSEAVSSETASGDSQQPVVGQLSRAECDEIDELRRLSLELSEPEPVVYTTA